MKRLLPFIVLIVLILAAVVSVPFLLRPESHRVEITEKLSKLLKRPVVIGPLSMIYWPPTLHLAQVGVMNETHNPVLQIDSVEAVLDLPSLLHLHFSPATIQLNHPVFTTMRLPDGSWDFDAWLSGFPGITGDNAGILHQVSWKLGEIHAMDRYASAPQELVLGAMDGSWDPKQGTLLTTGAFTGIGAPAHISLSAKGQFFASPQWTGDLQLADLNRSGTFHIDKHAAVCDVKGGASEWSLSNVVTLTKFYGRGSVVTGSSSDSSMLGNWQFHSHKEAGILTVENTGTLAGGASEIKGKIDEMVTPRMLHVGIALKEVPAETLLSALGENIPLSGKVTGLAENVEIALSSSAVSSLKGDGYFEVTSVRYKWPETSLQKLSKAKTMAYLKKKFPDLTQNGIPLTKISAHWQAKNGKININDGFLMSADLKVGGVGSLDIPHEGIDGYVRLQLHEKDPALSRLIPAKYHSQPAFGRLQGTWQEWFLRATTASKIPSAVQANLRKAISAK